MKLIKNQVMLKDLMFNFHPESGGCDEYCKGLLVGAVSALMSTGISWEDAITHCAINMPDTTRSLKDTTPPTWHSKFVSEYLTSHGNAIIVCK